MDGMHRIARALMEGRAEIEAVHLCGSPLGPGYRSCQPDDFPCCPATTGNFPLKSSAPSRLASGGVSRRRAVSAVDDYAAVDVQDLPGDVGGVLAGQGGDLGELSRAPEWNVAAEFAVLLGRQGCVDERGPYRSWCDRVDADAVRGEGAGVMGGHNQRRHHDEGRWRRRKACWERWQGPPVSLPDIRRPASRRGGAMRRVAIYARVDAVPDARDRWTSGSPWSPRSSGDGAAGPSPPRRRRPQFSPRTTRPRPAARRRSLGRLRRGRGRAS